MLSEHQPRRTQSLWREVQLVRSRAQEHMRHLLGSQNQQGKRRSSEPGCIRASGLLITLDRDHISAPKTRASSNLSSFSAWWGDMTLLGICGMYVSGPSTRTGRMPGRDSTSLSTSLDMVCLVQNEADLAFALLAQCFQTSPELIADVKPRARVWLRDVQLRRSYNRQKSRMAPGAAVTSYGPQRRNGM